jgi:ABC-type multidrug transport system fused ATPase/permease subunit
MLDFLNQYHEILIYISVVSFILLVVMILSTPWLVGKIPSDYFTNEIYDKNQDSFLVLLFKNILGVILLFLGFIMLFTPGQGIITVLIALMIMQFPGKRKLEKKIIANKNVLKILNWLRSKNNKEPLKWN